MSIRRFFRRSRWDDERARELEAHLAIETDDNVARGMTPDEARDAARRKLGNTTLVREEIYRMNTVTALETVVQDVRHGLRLLRLNPAFALVATLSLALGVGANTAIFQLLDAVRLRTLPVHDPQQLAEARIAVAKGGRSGHFTSRRPMLTYPIWEGIRDRQQAFSSVFVWAANEFNLTTGGEGRYAQGLWVSGDFFQTLGVPALAGRVLTREDDRPGCAAPPAVISYGFWQREYGGEPSILGREILLDGHAYAVAGVMPPSFFGVEVGRAFDVAIPLCAEPLSTGADSAITRPASWFLAMFGRLKPGWTLERADAHLAALSAAIFAETVPSDYRADDAEHYRAFKLGAFAAKTGVSNLRRDYESPLWLLLGTTGLVLVIACANLANLMLARATAREREVAVRLAIGASRWRVVRQLLAESLLLAIAGAAAGALLARWLSAFLVGLLATDRDPIFVALAIDWRVFAFTAALAVLTCAVFGLAPAIRVTGLSPGAAMKAGSRGSTDARERFGLRRALVVAQVALSLVLVAGALLFVRSFRNLMTADAGFRQDGVLIVRMDLTHAGVPAGRQIAFRQEIVDRLAALPGVRSAAQTRMVPTSGGFWNENIVVAGKVQPDYINLNVVSPGYFGTMGMPILNGRDFDVRLDTPASEKVVIVNQAFARKVWPTANPIGETFQIDEPPGVPRPAFRVIAIVKDSKYDDLRETFGPIGFFAAAQNPKPRPELRVALRYEAPTAVVTAAVTGSMAALDRSIELQFQTLETQIRNSLLRERLMATLSGIFGALAGLIAAIGLYGVMSYMVARRRNEIGIRMALGAGRADVLGMVMREAAGLLVAGLAIGLVLAVAASTTAKSLLFGLKPWDPSTLALGAAGLAAVAMLASYLPALRAARLEPTEALREE
jgi:putative ABC transport system permease protein